jgi:ferredoxin
MSNHKIAIVFFSATNVTKTYARAIQEQLPSTGGEAELIDVTPYLARQKSLPVDNFSGFIFGFPVYADFAPRVINEWLPTLKGRGKKCAMFFTYGARTTGYAHFHTKLLLEKAGFQVQFSAEFLGPHTFNLTGWRILPARPDEHDLAVAREFADLALKRFSADTAEVFRLQKPFAYNSSVELLKQGKKSSERRWTNPVRSSKECQMCRRCESECPAQAFNADTGLSEPLKCIECLHCIYICPDKVLSTDKRMKDVYSNFLNDWHLTEEIMNEKKSRIITLPRQAAC